MRLFTCWHIMKYTIKSLQPYYSVVKESLHMAILKIYTDGACSGNQNESNIGGWGCVLEYAGREKELWGGEVDTTNNRMELTALIEALKAVTKDGQTVEICSDSSYLVNCFRSHWYENWEKNGWKNSKKQPVENRALWEELLSLYRKHRVRFFLVKGHVSPEASEEKLRAEYARFVKNNGDVPFESFMTMLRYNNRCDALANRFIDEERERRGKES